MTALCDAQAASNTDVHLAARRDGQVSDAVQPGNPNVGLLLHGSSITETYRARRGIVQQVAEGTGIVHDHGLWLPSNYVTARAAARFITPYIVSTRGMLQPWSLQQERAKKAVAWRLYQRRILATASVLHATADSEADAIRSLGLKTPVAVISNGVAMPEVDGDPKPGSKTRRALFLSRVHPGKGLDSLLRAWGQVRPKGWELIVAGPEEGGHRRELEELSDRLGLHDVVSFLGAVADSEKWDLYASAELFVLPTHSENFGIVVAEAMAAGLPVITTKGAPWAVLETIRSGWWIDHGVEPLVEALQHAVSLPDEERRAMGERGRAHVEKSYSWDTVAEKMIAVYTWMLGQGSRPDWVET